MASFLIHGKRRLSGAVQVSGSKNAALPILAATLLTKKKCVLKNVPRIRDTETMVKILEFAGKKIEWRNHTIVVSEPREITVKSLRSLPEDLVCSLRAATLLLGPLLTRFGKCFMAFPGGCVLGKRSLDTHVRALEALGARVKLTGDGTVKAVAGGASRGGGADRASFLQGAKIVLDEFSVTATENVLLAAALAEGKTEIRMAAAEPHVADLANFLAKMGVNISGQGTHRITVQGRKNVRGAVHKIRSDYLEAGTFALASLLTDGDVTLKNLHPEDLDALWNVLTRMGGRLAIKKNSVRVRGPKAAGKSSLPPGALLSPGRVQTAVHPGFPTDLQAPMVVLLAHAKGKTLVHEALFEDRFRYVPELKKMGATIDLLNPHQILVCGNGGVGRNGKLRGTPVKSWDIRAGAAMLLAGLAASGKTEVTDIHYIDRGYENFEKKLQKLGADIVRRP